MKTERRNNMLKLTLIIATFFASGSATAETDISRYASPPDLLLKVGERLPQFSLRDTEGSAWNNADLTGKPTVLAFFSAYCGPCMKEIPSLNAFMQQHPEVRVVVVSPDDAGTAKSVRTEHGLDWPMLADAGETLDGWGVLSFPSFLLLDADGAIVSAPYGNRLTGTDELGYVTASGMSKWVKSVLPND